MDSKVLHVNEHAFVEGTKGSGLEGSRTFAPRSSEYCFFLKGTVRLLGINKIK